jgi:hypothetical protein
VEEVGRISPHLLDRFSIRINAAELRSSLTPAELVLRATATRAADDLLLEPLPEARPGASCSAVGSGLGALYRRIGKETVTATPIIEVLPAAEAFRAYRDAQVEIGWPATRVLYRDAARYLQWHGLVARMTNPAKTATDRGTERAK